jgi:hypothetical protein
MTEAIREQPQLHHDIPTNGNNFGFSTTERRDIIGIYAFSSEDELSSDDDSPDSDYEPEPSRIEYQDGSLTSTQSEVTQTDQDISPVSQTTVEIDRPPFDFLGLPMELRSQIYKHWVPSESPT